MFTPGPKWVCLWYEPLFIRRWCLHTRCFLVTSDPVGQRRETSQWYSIPTSSAKISRAGKRRGTQIAAMHSVGSAVRHCVSSVAQWVHTYPLLAGATTASPKPQRPTGGSQGRGRGWGTWVGAVVTQIGDATREMQGSCNCSRGGRGIQDVHSKPTFASDKCLYRAYGHRAKLETWAQSTLKLQNNSK